MPPFGHLWQVLSRKRPKCPANSPIRARGPATGSGLNRHFVLLIYQGLGSTGPLALFYALAVVVNSMAGDKISVALVVALVASLLAGVCYLELLGGSRECSGNMSTAVYQLVGEFPSYVIGVLSCLAQCAALAALTKAMSSCLDEMSRGRVTAWAEGVFGSLPGHQHPPDVLAFGAAFVTSVLLACGLQQAGFLRFLMNAMCAVSFVLAAAAGSDGVERAASEGSTPAYTYERAIFGSGVCVVLFAQYVEVGRRSKKPEFAGSSPKAAYATSSVGLFSLYLILGVITSLLPVPREGSTGSILLKYLIAEKYQKSALCFGLMQVVVFGLGMSEAGESFGRQLVCLAGNGFVPSYLSKESSRSFSHARALLVGGFVAALFALLTTHSYVLELMAANILMLNITVIIVVMYRPYRYTYGGLCSIAATTTSRNLSNYLGKTRTASIARTTQDLQKTTPKTVNKVSSRVRSLEDDEIPLVSTLLSPTDQGSGELREQEGSSESLNSYNVTLVLQGNEEMCDLLSRQTNSSLEVLNNYDPNSNDALSIELQQLPSRDVDTTNEESDHYLEEEDVDAIIEEYKTNMRNQISGAALRKYPTKKSAITALMCIFQLLIFFFALALCTINYIKIKEEHEHLPLVKKLLTLIVFGVILITFVILVRLPINTHSSSQYHYCLLCTTAAALLLNVVLFVEVVIEILWVFVASVFIALIWYGLYSVHRSAAALSGFRTPYVSALPKKPGRETLRFSDDPFPPTLTKIWRPQGSVVSRNLPL